MPIITYLSHIYYASLHDWGVILDGRNSGKETDEKKDDREEKRQRSRDVLDQASRSLHSRGWQLGCSGQSWGGRARLPTSTRKGALHPWGCLHVSLTSSIEPSLALCARHLSLWSFPSSFLLMCHVLQFPWWSGSFSREDSTSYQQTHAPSEYSTYTGWMDDSVCRETKWNTQQWGYYCVKTGMPRV